MTALAQPAPSPELGQQKEAMEAVQFLVGEWKGSGWIDMGQGRSEFVASEVVESRLNRLALLVEGRHIVEPNGSPNPIVVHHALAMLTYDPAAGMYRFNSQVARGGTGMYEGSVEDGAFIWRMEAGGGQVRYRIRLDEEGRWDEVGEYSADGANWSPFFGMTLEKID